MPLTIAIPSLMGHLRDPAQYQRATQRMRALGHTLIEDPNVYEKHGFFSAPVAARLEVFHAMLQQKPDVVMPTRGGYGITHVLPHIDWAQVKASGAACVGFSDFTGFSMAALNHGIVTYAGPLMAPDFGNEAIDAFANAQCWSTLASGSCEIAVESEVPAGLGLLEIEGTLWGTNLSLLAHLVGTPYLPRINHGILLIEDIGEEPYACDRALMQLDHAGHLKHQRALILGAFNGYDVENGSSKSYPFSQWVEDVRARYPFPVLTGFPFGHVATKATLPMGGHARLKIEAVGYTLSVSATSANPLATLQ